MMHCDFNKWRRLVALAFVSLASIVSNMRAQSDAFASCALWPAKFFEVYEEPQVPELGPQDIREYHVQFVAVSTYVLIDTSGLAVDVVLNPLYGVGNQLPAEHRIWDQLDTALINASTRWRFLPYFYDLDGAPDGANKYINTSARWRPNAGWQTQMITWIYYPVYDECWADKQYSLRLYGR